MSWLVSYWILVNSNGNGTTKTLIIQWFLHGHSVSIKSSSVSTGTIDCNISFTTTTYIPVATVLGASSGCIFTVTLFQGNESKIPFRIYNASGSTHTMTGIYCICFGY